MLGEFDPGLCFGGKMRAWGRKLVVILVDDAHWDHENESSLGSRGPNGTGDWEGSCVVR